MGPDRSLSRDLPMQESVHVERARGAGITGGKGLVCNLVPNSAYVCIVTLSPATFLRKQLIYHSVRLQFMNPNARY